jgi:hypothetical protein
MNSDRHKISGSSAGFVALPAWAVLQGGRIPSGETAQRRPSCGIPRRRQTENPLIALPNSAKPYLGKIEQSSNRTNNAILGLRRCFQGVTQMQESFGVFGAKMQRIPILVATEVEAQCRAIFRANQYRAEPEGRRWKMARP